MPRPGKNIGRTVAAYLGIGFIKLTRHLPLSFNRRIALAVARLAMMLVPRIKKVGLANLDLAYGDALTYDQKMRLLRGAVDNLALVAAEFTRAPDITEDAAGHGVRLVGLEHLAHENGAILVGGHLGNWEWMPPAFIPFIKEVGIIVRPLDHPKLNALVDSIRTASGVQAIPKDSAAREVFKLLRRGGQVGILIDQSPRDNGVPVTFFGQPCWATAAPALLARRSNVAVHPATMIRDVDGKYTLRVEGPIELVKTDDFQADLLENTQRIQDRIEDIVRRHPEQWLWLHRRWKKRPRLEREWTKRAERKKARAESADAGGS